MAHRHKPSSSSTGRPEWEEVASSWESLPEAGMWDEENEDDEDATTFWESEQVSAEDAEDELVSFLLENHRRGKFSARDIAIIGFWCGRAGLKQVEPLGIHPGSASGSFKRHIDSFMRKRAGKPFPRGYCVPIPAFVRATGERGTYPLTCTPPHEILELEMQEKDIGKVMQDWQELPNWKSHPVVAKMKASKPVLPLALYLDAVGYTVRDSLLVVTLRNLATDANHVICILRKKLLCGGRVGCGCRGWCSLAPLWLFIRWSLDALSEGVYPAHRHNTELDGDSLQEGWRPEDDERRGRAGDPLPFAGAILQLRCDWGEMSSRLGLSNWSTHSDPCFLCKSTNETMLQASMITQRKSAWIERDAADYDASCQRCEIVLETRDLSDKLWKRLMDALSMDARKEGARGLALKWDLPSLSLKKGDRIEPSQSLLDWATLYQKRPEKIVLWRRSQETSTRHRNAMMSKSLGTTLDFCFAADLMHCWCLGLHQQFLAHGFWRVLESNVFPPVSKSGNKEDKILKRMKALTSHLLSWYKKFCAQNPGVTITRVNDLTVEMLGGNASSAQLKCKAHETLGLLRYASASFPSWQESMQDGKLWSDAACLLMDMWTLLEHAPLIVDEATQKAVQGVHI